MLDSVTGARTDDETRSCVLATAALLDELGHHVEETPSPVSARFADDFSLYWGLLGFLVSRTGTRILDPEFDVALTDNLTKGLAEMCRRELARTPGMLHRLRRSTHEYRTAFTRYDVLLSPVLGHTTPPLGHLSPTLPFDELFARLKAYVGFTPLNNAAGGPAISLPSGRTQGGLPIGCHFSADLGDERTLLELAFELEEARPWPRIQDAGAPAADAHPVRTGRFLDAGGPARTSPRCGGTDPSAGCARASTSSKPSTRQSRNTSKSGNRSGVDVDARARRCRRRSSG